MINEQILNKKLAEWAGFKFVEVLAANISDNGLRGYWLCPDGNAKMNPTRVACLPNFPESLDACVKWLVPKLHTWEIENEPLDKSKSFACVEYNIPDGAEGYDAIADTPALALCLAIEKLINE